VSKTINTRTYKYRTAEGLLLRQGKRTIKAICVLSDGRESSIVSRDFLVKWIPSESDEEEEEDEEVYKTLEESRAARNNSFFGSKSQLQNTNRTLSGLPENLFQKNVFNGIRSSVCGWRFASSTISSTEVAVQYSRIIR